MPGVITTIWLDDEAAVDLFAALIEMEIEVDHRLASACRINLAIRTRPDGLWTFLDDKRLKLWSRLKITVKLTDEEVEIFRGYVTEFSPRISGDANSSTLEIIGLDETCLMSLEEKIKSWINTSDSDIARVIFQSYGFQVEVEDTGIVHDEASSTIIQRETDIQFLKRLARRNGYECFVTGGKGFFRKPATNSAPQRTLAANFGAETNLVNFEARVEALRPAAIEAHQVDVIAKELQAASVATSDERQLGRTGARAVVAPNGVNSKMFVKGMVATNRAQMERAAGALYDEAAWFVEGGGEIDSLSYGVVLRARGLVPIKGVGEMLSGIYYVTSVRHIFGGTGYAQQFKVRRNALAPSGADDFGGKGALAAARGGRA